MAKVAFIGLGVMGYPMAGHLAHAGHQVCVYNRTAARAEQWLSEFAGTSAATPREAAATAELVMVCVGNDDDLRGVGERAGGRGLDKTGHGRLSSHRAAKALFSKPWIASAVAVRHRSSAAGSIAAILRMLTGLGA